MIHSKDTFGLYKSMTDTQVLTAYHGEFNYKVVNMLLVNIKMDLKKRDIPVAQMKKTYNILIESLENIQKHSSEFTMDEAFNPNADGILVLGVSGQDYVVTVGNIIYKTEILNLQKKIDKINGLSEVELKAFHNEVLALKQLSQRNGAGLGLIEMCLKSKNKLLYEFSDINAEFSLFSLRIKISSPTA